MNKRILKNTLCRANTLLLLFLALSLLSVMPVKASMALNRTSLSLLTDETFKLKVSGTDRSIAWKSSKKKVAAVSAQGKVRGIAQGSAKIRAYVEGTDKVLVCKVRVSSVVDCKGKLTGESNKEKVFRYLVSQGYTKKAAAAVVGNLMYESGSTTDIRLNAVEWGTGRGVGMCQWTNTSDASRRTNFVNYCNAQGVGWPNNNLRVQLNFLMKELNGDYGNLWYFLSYEGYSSSYCVDLKKFQKCKDLRKAVGIFCANFERPYASNAGLYRRYLLASAVYKAYK